MRSLSSRNTSGLKGTWVCSKTNRWFSEFNYGGKRYLSSAHQNKISAATSYDLSKISVKGTDIDPESELNFPERFWDYKIQLGLEAKTCSKCKQPKPLGEYAKDSSKKSKLNSWCRDCHRVYNKAKKDKASMTDKTTTSVKKETMKHSDHHNRGSMGVLDAIERWGLTYSEGSVIASVAQHRHKDNPLESLREAKQHLDRLIAKAEKGYC